MHCHCGTNNRAPRWTDPCKPEVRPRQNKITSQFSEYCIKSVTSILMNVCSANKSEILHMDRRTDAGQIYPYVALCFAGACNDVMLCKAFKISNKFWYIRNIKCLHGIFEVHILIDQTHTNYDMSYIYRVLLFIQNQIELSSSNFSLKNNNHGKKSCRTKLGLISCIYLHAFRDD